MKACEHRAHARSAWAEDQPTSYWHDRSDYERLKRTRPTPDYDGSDRSKRILAALEGGKTSSRLQPAKVSTPSVPKGSRAAMLALTLDGTRRALAGGFLYSLYMLARLQAERQAVSAVYSFMHEAIQAGEYPLIDVAFQMVDEHELQPSMAISFLMSTLPVKDRLSSTLRRSFAARAEKHIKAKWGKAEAKELRFYI